MNKITKQKRWGDRKLKR